jgi:hypothetical protein
LEVIWIALIAFLSLIGVGMLIAGAVIVFLRFRSGINVQISMRLLLRLYLYIVVVVGLILFTQGASHLLRAGFAAAWGNEFSYQPVYVSTPEELVRGTDPLELKPRDQLTDEELERLSQILADRERRQAELRQVKLERGLDRAHKEGLIKGISFAIIGGVIWLVHVLGRRWLETEEETASIVNRVYLVLIVVIFGVITIVNLPQGVFEGLRYALLDDFDELSRYQPGGKLALSIASLPIWIVYLTGAIRAVRRGG